MPREHPWTHNLNWALRRARIRIVGQQRFACTGIRTFGLQWPDSARATGALSVEVKLSVYMKKPGPSGVGEGEGRLLNRLDALEGLCSGGGSESHPLSVQT